MRIAQGCPIDAEGVGPFAGDVGRVVALPVPEDTLRCLRVHFERLRTAWLIPVRYLEPV